MTKAPRGAPSSFLRGHGRRDLLAEQPHHVHVLVDEVLEEDAPDAEVLELAQPLDDLLRRPDHHALATLANEVVGVAGPAEPRLQPPDAVVQLGAVPADDAAG